MDFSSFNSNDIEIYNKQPQKKPLSNNNNKTFNLTRNILLGIILTFGLVMIILVSIRSNQCKTIQLENSKQKDLNDRQRAINDQMMNHIGEVEQMKNVVVKSLEGKQEQLDVSVREYKKLCAEKRSNDNDILMIFAYLDSKIEQEKKKIESLKIQQEKNNEEKEYYTMKVNNLFQKRQKLYEQITAISNPFNSNNNNHNKLESVLITNHYQRDFIKGCIQGGNLMIMNLVYQGTAGNNSLKDFKKICKDSNYSNTLVVMQIKNGPIIGGFTYNNWIKKGFMSDEYSFLFNLTKLKEYRIYNKSEASYSMDDVWPSFGLGDIFIPSFSMCTTNFPHSYGIGSKQYELTDGLERFEIETFEVFTLKLNL